MGKKMFFFIFVSSLSMLQPFYIFAQNSENAEKRTNPAYRIGSGDILKIVTWKEPGLTLEHTLVRSDGNITFPLLYDVDADGSTPLELSRKIEGGLKEFVEAPYVTVEVVEPQSKKFYVLGEVAKTGEYPLFKELTVLQAFAIAGGFTEWASKKEILLLRKIDGKEKFFRVNYKEMVNGEDIQQNLILEPNDTIIVP